jgi:hypothetical protein
MSPREARILAKETAKQLRITGNVYVYLIVDGSTVKCVAQITVRSVVTIQK